MAEPCPPRFASTGSVEPAVEISRAQQSAPTGLSALEEQAARAVAAARRSAAQQAVLVAIARALDGAVDEGGVLAVVAAESLALLGANGAGLCLPEPAGSQARLLMTSDYTDVLGPRLARVPASLRLPPVVSATTGEAFFLPDRASTLALFPGTEELYGDSDVEASASVPLRSGEQLLGCLSLGFSTSRVWVQDEHDLLEALAALTAQALERITSMTAQRESAAAAHRSAQQQRALVAIAQTLGEAETEDDVLAVISAQGLRLLGAHGGGMCLLEQDGQHARVITSPTYTAQVRAQIQHVPVSFPIPPVDAAVTGRAHFLRDCAETVERFPGAETIYVSEGVEASASVPMSSRGRALGCLSVAFDVVREWPEDERDLVEAFAALTAQALERITAREAERVASRAVARFAETLQRSLLSTPPQLTGLQIAVRYLPAVADAQVGGDWYDAFETSDGSTHLVVGDVTGHDQQAAASMAQLRNLLRGITHTLVAPSSQVLSALDRTLADLHVDTLASVVLARLAPRLGPGAASAARPGGDQVVGEGRVLHWSNAGHPPPLLITTDGTTRFLDAEPDLLLGFDPGTERREHSVVLEPGSTVLLYTDGLVERRDTSLQVGLDWLADTVADLARLEVSDLCEALLGLVGDEVEDDVALLLVRAQPTAAPAAASTAAPATASAPLPRSPAGAPSCERSTGVGAHTAVARGLVLEPDPAAVHRARSFVVQRCEEHDLSEDTRDTVELLTSEVVTNAFLHGRSRTRLDMSLSGTTDLAVRVRVEVGDDNSTHPTLVAEDSGSLNGRGIALVELLATDWGVREETIGKTVWFELDAPLLVDG
jgi:serine phosphatase RsbU (regulator of sigma subunit)/anti-sigma regulatory factor (Ser/Thr protein kinase)